MKKACPDTGGRGGGGGLMSSRLLVQAVQSHSVNLGGLRRLEHAQYEGSLSQFLSETRDRSRRDVQQLCALFASIYINNEFDMFDVSLIKLLAGM